MLAWLEDDHLAGQSVSTIWAHAFDQGVHIASRRTWYRIAAQHRLTRPLRPRRPAPRPRPEIEASAPHDAWCWDFTALPTPIRGQHYAAAVVIDLHSRAVVAATVLETEATEPVVALLTALITQYGAPRVLHADGGAVMTSTAIQHLLDPTPAQISHSRPRTPNDNPYIESWFRTAKQHLSWPGTFACLAEAQAWLASVVTWYNTSHHHSGLGWHTPNAVLTGIHHEQSLARQRLLDAAYAANPQRYRQPPRAPQVPLHTWINPPTGTPSDSGNSPPTDSK